MNEDLRGKDLVQLLDMLAQPEAPAPVSLMPATAGWVWLGLAPKIRARAVRLRMCLILSDAT